jgi:tetratricopeptide (TPR) repeat protein
MVRFKQLAAPPRSEAVTLGEKIRAARLEQKLTQEQLAGHDFTKSYISELERGVRTPRLTTLKILARRLSRPLAHFRDGVPEDREAEAFLRIGLAYLHAQVFEQARSSLERASDLATEQGDEILQARVEVGLALVDQQTGHTTRALRRLDRSLGVLGRSRDPSLLAAAQACLGSVRLEAGDAVSAGWIFQAALRLAEQLPDPSLLAHLHLQSGIVHQRLGQVEEARAAFRRALEVATPFRDQDHARTWHLGLAVTAARQGLFEQAAEEAGKALAISETIVHKCRLAEIYRHLAEADLHDGRWDEAQRHYRWSVALSGAAGDSGGAAQTLGCFAEAMVERASPEAARELCRAALDLLPVPAGGDRRERAHILRARGTILRILGRREEAKASLAESLTCFDELRRTDEARTVRQELALLALDAHDLGEARRHMTGMRGVSALRGMPSGF